MRSALLAAMAAFAIAWLAAPTAARAQPFSTPIGCEDCINYWYYLDHGDNTDYECGSATYSGHNGSDYSLRGGNSAIADGNEVIAVAAGVVTVASDGNYDMCTECGGSGCGVDTPGGGFSNYVVIDHGTHDTTYGHLRNGSVAVQVGDTVECGQVLGHIGSSGCSTGAHLHFQPRSAGGSYTMNALDPYEGACSPTPSSLWGEQGPYRGVPGSACDDVPPGDQCPVDTDEIWTCAVDGSNRRRCIDGVDSIEDCPWGCTVMATGSDDVCALPPDDDGDGVRADTDCDDARSDVHPGALELCGDGVDQDCNGGDEPCDPAGTGGVAPGTGGLATTGGLTTGGVPPNGGTGGVPVPTGGVVTTGGFQSNGGTGGGAATTGGVATTTGGTLATSGGTVGTGGLVLTGGSPPGTGRAGADPGAGGFGAPVASERTEEDRTGCACRAATRRGSTPGWLLALGVVAFGVARRRCGGGRRGTTVGHQDPNRSAPKISNVRNGTICKYIRRNTEGALRVISPAISDPMSKVV